MRLGDQREGKMELPPSCAVEFSTRSMDITTCPTSAYLVPRGDADLMVKAGCNLDYALAELWGGRLERGGTIAEGCGRCTFRFVGGATPATMRAAPPSGRRATA